MTLFILSQGWRGETVADEPLLVVLCPRSLGAGPYYVRSIALGWIKEAGRFMARAVLEQWPLTGTEAGEARSRPEEIRVGIAFGGQFPGLVTPSALNMLLLQGKQIRLSSEVPLEKGESDPKLHVYGVDEIESLVGKEFQDRLSRDYGPRAE